MGQSLGCYLVGISSRFLWLRWLCYYWAATWLAILSPNFPIDCHLSNLYQTFNVTVQTWAAVSLASSLVLKLFFLLHSFTIVQQFFAFQLLREICFFCGASATVRHSCVACGGFLSSHFLFSRLIGLHIWMCCDSVSFDFIKPATTVARFIQHSCLFIYFKSVPYRKVRNLKCKQSSRSVGPCFEHMRWYKLYLNDNSSSTYIKHIQLTLGEELTSNLYNLTSNSWHYSCPRSVYCRSIVFLLVM